ncbi:hypothetical protein [Micromonospora sp. NPDC050200]|uniref:hypothetical protein n=1 Tax=Micromonospora sp. NPDC050200 TaxID=3155664 RepID=UPI00340EE8D8
MGGAAVKTITAPQEYDRPAIYGTPPAARPDLSVYNVPLLLGEEEGYFGDLR